MYIFIEQDFPVKWNKLFVIKLFKFNMKTYFDMLVSLTQSVTCALAVQ